MAIKSVMSNKMEDRVLTYPLLKKSTESSQVVLFTCQKTGTVVKKGVHSYNSGVGFFSTSWSEENFVPFEGTITLSNKE